MNAYEKWYEDAKKFAAGYDQELVGRAHLQNNYIGVNLNGDHRFVIEVFPPEEKCEYNVERTPDGQTGVTKATVVKTRTIVGATANWSAIGSQDVDTTKLFGKLVQFSAVIAQLGNLMAEELIQQRKDDLHHD